MTEVATGTQEQYSEKQRKALGAARTLATVLVAEYREPLLELYRGDFGYGEIAKQLPPEFRGKTSRVTLTAVQMAVQSLVPESERVELELKHKAVVDQQRRESNHFAKMAVLGGNARNAVITEPKKAEIAQMATKARGQTPWTEEERQWALGNADSFRNPKGKLDVGSFAQRLNELFHLGEKVRSINVDNTLRSFQSKDKTK